MKTIKTETKRNKKASLKQYNKPEDDNKMLEKTLKAKTTQTIKYHNKNDTNHKTMNTTIANAQQ